MEQPRAGAGADRIELLRHWILVVLVLGLVGTLTELILLQHYEQPFQLVPVVLIASALAILAWYAIRSDAGSLRALQIVMTLFVLAGFIGVAVHFLGSAEFQFELNPSMSTWELVEKVMRAKAPPVLAPGMMLQLGLLGLAYAFSDVRYRTRVLRVLGFSLQQGMK
ncbi:MAG: hypothetical protein QOG83_2547 [Alphaproteobacteria bacterium]|nr:hypothetical protein [Alphaproteobacteria bacterium]